MTKYIRRIFNIAANQQRVEMECILNPSNIELINHNLLFLGCDFQVRYIEHGYPYNSIYVQIESIPNMKLKGEQNQTRVLVRIKRGINETKFILIILFLVITGGSGSARAEDENANNELSIPIVQTNRYQNGLDLERPEMDVRAILNANLKKMQEQEKIDESKALHEHRRTKAEIKY